MRDRRTGPPDRTRRPAVPFADPITDRSTLYVTCTPGLAPCVADEIAALGLPVGTVDATGVATEGGLDEAIRLNLELRTAMHVLLQVARFPCSTPQDLQQALRGLPWERWIDVDSTLSVLSRVNHPSIRNTMYANVAVKDAVVDRIRAERGARPDSGPDLDGVVLDLFWSGDTAVISVNTSGPKLSDRGYRRLPHHAPVRETLAAGVLHLAGYDPARPLLAPMCGSGTFAIEGALRAAGRAPGLLRSAFAMRHLKGFPTARFDSIRADLRRRRAPAQVGPIFASDLDPGAIHAARANAMTAGVEQRIRFEVADFESASIPDEPGLVVMNPEYGRRLGDPQELAGTWRRIGDFLKQRLPGWRAAILCGESALAKQIGLRPARRLPVVHAGLDARILLFDLYEGSRRP